MGRLTKRSVDAATPPESGQAFLWDSELRGLGVRVMPSGKRTFILQYRTDDGRSRRIKLGVYGVMTVEQARREARIKLGEVAKGHDPCEQSRHSRASVTVAEVCDWYLREAEAGRLIGRRHIPIKASTLEGDRSRIAHHIKPLLGKRRVKSLKLSDVERMQMQVFDGETAVKRMGGRGGATRGGVGAAARSVSTLHSVLAHAVRHEIIEINPAAGARRLQTKKRNRRLSESEIVRLGATFRRAEALGESRSALDCVRLLLLTGFRLSEGQQLEWSWVSLDRQEVDFPDTKSGRQVRALGGAAVELLAAQSTSEWSRYVFPSDIVDKPITTTPACLARLCHLADIDRITPHVLRHTYASVAADLGFTELTIAALLGHSARGITQAYIHIDDAAKLAADRVSQWIETRLSLDA